MASRFADFILLPGFTPVLTLDPFAPVMAKTISKIEEMEKVQLLAGPTLKEAVSLITQLGPCVVIAYAPDEAALLQVEEFVSSLRERIRAQQLKILLLTPLLDHSTTKRLEIQFGVEMTHPMIQEKSLLLRIEKYISLLPSNSGLTEVQSFEAFKALRTPKVEKYAALTTDKDLWRIGGSKRGDKQWMVWMKGPAAETHEWREIRPQCWAFKPKDDVLPIERWVFNGSRKPEWMGSYWWFAGEAISLRLELQQGEVLAKRFYTEGQWTLQISDDPAVVTENPAGSADRTGKDEGGYSVVMMSPIQILSDFWIYTKNGAKKIGHCWMVRMKGPPLSFGKWVVSEQSGWWNWVPREPSCGGLLAEMGEWRYQGLQPRLDGTTWVFAGDHPLLVFVRPRRPGTPEGAVEKIRLGDSADQLRVAANSQRTADLAKKVDRAWSLPYLHVLEALASGQQGVGVEPVALAYALAEKIQSGKQNLDEIREQLLQTLAASIGGAQVLWIGSQDARITEIDQWVYQRRVKLTGSHGRVLGELRIQGVGVEQISEARILAWGEALRGLARMDFEAA